MLNRFNRTAMVASSLLHPSFMLQSRAGLSYFEARMKQGLAIFWHDHCFTIHEPNQRVMKKIIIAASLVGTAVAGAFWLMKNRNRAESALNDIKDAARNAYRKMDKQARKAGRRANHMVQEQMA
jgi:hypothetical protein